ncbi:MAG: hypothetical protein KDC35_21335 [Acidobacteria bacterium]|nr:hypothetical protein [Acidobacteriota bacterium]
MKALHAIEALRLRVVKDKLNAADTNICMIISLFVSCAMLLPQLPAVRYPDAVAYLWPGAFNPHFMNPRSLTQRVLFNLSGSNDTVIAFFHLGAYAAWATLLYLSLKTENTKLNTIRAISITLLFSSYTFTLGSLSITSEPLHIALMGIWFVTSFRSRSPQLFWSVGLAFVLSKNTAPYVAWGLCAVLIGAHLIRKSTRVDSEEVAPRTGVPPWRHVLCMGIAATAVALYTQKFDTSLQLNLANNVFARILPDHDDRLTFIDRYGMPDGDYIQRVSGKLIHTPMDGANPNYRINPRSWNYELNSDPYGFKIWLTSVGQSALYRHWFVDKPLETLEEICEAYGSMSQGSTITFFSEEISGYMPHRVGYVDAWSKQHPHQRAGFFGFDPISTWWHALTSIGLGRIAGIVWIALACLGLYLITQHIAWLSCFAQLCAGVCLFALNYLGDPMELHRHVAPALILIAVAAHELVWNLLINGGELALICDKRLRWFMIKLTQRR